MGGGGLVLISSAVLVCVCMYVLTPRPRGGQAVRTTHPVSPPLLPLSNKAKYI
jgi:hypothetical protein